MKFCAVKNEKCPSKKIYEVSFKILKILKNQKVLQLSEYFDFGKSNVKGVHLIMSSRLSYQKTATIATLTVYIAKIYDGIILRNYQNHNIS